MKKNPKEDKAQEGHERRCLINNWHRSCDGRVEQSPEGVETTRGQGWAKSSYGYADEAP